MHNYSICCETWEKNGHIEDTWKDQLYFDKVPWALIQYKDVI